MQINENLLIEQLNRFSKARKKYQQRVEERKAEQRSGQSREVEDISQKSVIKSGIYKAETGLISLLLDGEEAIQKYIFSQIEHGFFEDEHILEIYEILIEEFEETGKLSTDLIISHFQENEEVIKLISELALSDKSNSQKFAEDCIFQLRKWQLQKEAFQFQQLIKQEAGNIKSVLHYNQKLSIILKKINTLQKEHRKIRKF